MKDKEQIISDSMKFEEPLKNYNLLEIQCFLALRQLIIMFYNKLIDKDKATKIKQQIITEYEKKTKEYRFKMNMFQEYIDNIKKTEMARTRLHKLMNKEDELTDVKMSEIINCCLEIISTVFKEEF